MLSSEVLRLLKEAGEPLSGEVMGQTLGVSRAAVWKGIRALRQAGYQIDSAPNRGYLLIDRPDRLCAGELAGDRTCIGRQILCLETVDSTNSEGKRQALSGAAEGLAILADRQTGGRGTRGRSFFSPAGEGLYCSVLLRPSCSLQALMGLTAWTAVAACDAVETVCGIRPGIKWTNDLVLEGKKLCGILTELGLEGESGQLEYVVVGIGINVGQTDFGPELNPIAVSLRQVLGAAPRRADLALALLNALDEMYAAFPEQKPRYLSRYRADCLTTGREVRFLQDGVEKTAWAESIDDQFALVVRYPDGSRETLSAGEVSGRGLCGYTADPEKKSAAPSRL